MKNLLIFDTYQTIEQFGTSYILCKIVLTQSTKRGVPN